MKLLKPAWISHDGDKPIFSVDIHPDGSRCATGGQGEDSGRITIWCMAPVVSKEAEEDESIPKQLCQMDNHLGCVNCVRWSKSGKFLASGGDDKLIMIWQCSRYSSASAVFGGGGKVNVEQWRCVSTLRGHEGDVLDLAWSPTDQWLATCSVDNNCIIWNMENSPEIVTTLKGHTGLVKGVSWDPIGKYLASQSDDKSVRIWRTSDWQAEAVVTDPFEECGGTTHVLRLSWSPDGQYLVSAHAMNGGGPTAQIIDREGWKTDKDFVGHRKAITCVNFNSNMLKKKTSEGSKVTNYCCCAIGSRDCSLSIWLTALKRPLVVIHDLFRSSVLDISWSASGLQLMACSWDGTVAFIEFTQEELGVPLSSDEKEVLYQKMYGRSYNASVKPSLAASIIENPEYLNILDDSSKEDAINSKEKSQPEPIMPASMEMSTPSSCSIIKGPIDKQIETRTMDGKRRITPIYIPPPPDLGEAPKPFLPTSALASTTFSSSTEHKSKIQVEKRDEVTVGAVQAMPTAVSATSTDVQSQPVLQAQALEARMGERDESSAKRKTFDKDKPKKLFKAVTLEKTSLPASSIGSPNIPKPTVVEKSKLLASTVALPQEEVRIANVLATLPVPATFSSMIPTVFSGKKAGIDVVNNARKLGPTYSVHKITYKQEPKVWEWTVSSPIIDVQGSTQVLSIACADATLHVLDHQGSRLFPAFALSAAACKLFVQNWHVAVVTSDARISLWDLRKPAALLKSESITHLLVNSGEKGSNLSIIQLNLTKDLAPMISFSNGKGFAYNSDLGTWMLLASSDDSVRQMSDMTAVSPEASSQAPLASLQASLGRGTRTSAVYKVEPELQATCTLAFLDQQVAASRALHSSSEYRHWLLGLVRYAAQQGLEDRLRLLCQDLLGPVYSTNGPWEATVLGHSKHQLLQDSLRIMASNVRLQRLCTEFLDQLNIAKKNSLNSL